MATILIVDDLAANRKVLATLLRYEGHRLLEAADGREGLAVVHAERPDLVIADVLMPVMDGYEFIRQLRLDPTTRAIPVVFCTAHYGEREARNLALSSGVSYVLTKPAEAEDVLRIVARALSGEAQTAGPLEASSLTTEFDREHLRLITDKLSQKAGDLTTANERLKALINIGLDLASERDSDRLLHNVCAAAADLFGATYVTLAILDQNDGTVQGLFTCGSDADKWIKVGDETSGILRTVVEERRTMRGDNSGSDPARLQLPSPHPDMQAFLVAPIASPALVYGWMCLVRSDGRPFTEDDEPLVLALSGQVGRIYENGHLYEAARQERDRAQRYLDTAEVILLALDTEGRITLANRYACGVLGWTADELIGRDWIETCLPARLRDAFRMKADKPADADLSIVESPILTRSGEERRIEWRKTVLRDHQGDVTGTISSGADITDRNQAIEALRTTEGRMRFALQSADVGIWDMDYTTGALQWSETIESHYGLEPGTFGGTFDAFIERIHPDDRESMRETFGKAMKSGADFSVTNRSIWPDGTVRWLSGAGRILLGEHGEPVRGVGISLDITEQQRLEEQLRQAQKLEAIGQLAGGIAHDFNNVLTAILGFTELILPELPVTDPLHANVLEIKKAGERAAGLTRQLLAFSRKQILQPEVMNINATISGTESLLKKLIPEHVNLTVSFTPKVGLIKMDPTQLEQILVNLVVNAADAMPRGGELTIETGNVTLDEHYQQRHLPVTPGDYVMLAVSDTGVGMDNATSSRIFEPFFTTKGIGKGTGLGLATVHGIVKQSGGDIWVHSELGHGSTFKIYLPQVSAGTQAGIERPTKAGAIPSGLETILLVEDDDAVRLLARVTLERAGYRVLQAENPKAAMRVVQDSPGPIHLLLSDVIMPESDGPPLFDALAKVHQSMGLLYMSGYADEAIVRHGVMVEGTPFLQKPFTPFALAQKVRDVLDARAPARQAVVEDKAEGKILVVDDDSANVQVFSRLMTRLGYEVATASSGEAALKAVTRDHPDLVLLDVNMPGIDGFEVCRRLKANPATRLIPVVLLTTLTTEDRIRGIEAGADDFLAKPPVVAELEARVRSLTRLKRYTDELDSAESVIFSLGLTIEARDVYTQGHCQRLAKYASALGTRIGLNGDQLVALNRGAFLHDVGKIGIPDAVLLKPGRLTAAEYALIQQHTVIGDNLCSQLRLLDDVRPIVRHHHERPDGTGYPDQLKGEAIPLLARIISVVDVYDALTTARSYKPALSAADASRELREEAAKGWKFEELVEEFITLVEHEGAEPLTIGEVSEPALVQRWRT